MEHQSLLGNVRMLHGSVTRMQTDTARTLREKGAAAQKWHDEARGYFREAGKLREERDALLATTAEQRGQLGRLDDAAADLKAEAADLRISRDAEA